MVEALTGLCQKVNDFSPNLFLRGTGNTIAGSQAPAFTWTFSVDFNKSINYPFHFVFIHYPTSCQLILSRL
jgi:hypothetical protein